MLLYQGILVDSAMYAIAIYHTNIIQHGGGNDILEGLQELFI